MKTNQSETGFSLARIVRPPLSILVSFILCLFVLISGGTSARADSINETAKVVDKALGVALGEDVGGTSSARKIDERLVHSGVGFEMTAPVRDISKLEVVAGEPDGHASQGGARAGGSRSEAVKLTIGTGLQGSGSVESGFIQGSQVSGLSKSLIQPVGDGVRILHVINNQDAPTEYVTEFSTNGSISPVSFEDDSLILHHQNGDYLGDIDQPWAVDAKGRSVPTKYEWQDGRLIQRVQHDPKRHVYPVVADPSWTYQFNLAAISPAGYPALGVNTSMAMRELRRCFNCSFPISGAPRSYPKVGQNIDLNAWPLPGNVNVPAPVRVTSSTETGFAFVARPGHFDGAGSTVSFRFYHTCPAGVAPNLRLSVNAGIEKNHNWVERLAVREVARNQWGNFVSRTADNTGQQQGWRGKC